MAIIKKDKKNKKEYDIIIIGAGPAGLKCAEELKNSKLTVLLIEKNNLIGPKICAGGLTGLVPRSDIPPGKTLKFPEESYFVCDKKYSLRWKTPNMTVSRTELGQYQLSKIARAKNISILTGAYAKEISKDTVVTNKGTFKFKFLVGADGAFSIVRKYLGLESKMIWAVNCEVPAGLKQFRHFSWYFIPQELRSNYIWVFPHKNCTNIGLCFEQQHISPEKAKSILKQFLAKKGYAANDKIFKYWAINYKYRGCVFSNIFLAGDAAGLASRTTGEGISFALISGQEIGRKIINPKYSMASLKRALRIKKKQERLTKVAGIFFSSKPNAHIANCAFGIGVRALKKSWFRKYFFGHK